MNEGWQKENPTGAFTWKHNALRHSFISYRELVRPADAEKWFGITPVSVAENR